MQPTQTPKNVPLWSLAIPALLLNTAIAMGITAFGEHSFSTNLVYSQCIGLSIALLIQQACHRLIRQWETQRLWLIGIVPLGAMLGMLLGTLLADRLLGNDSVGYWLDQPRQAVVFLTISLVAGTALTYFSISRAQLALERTHAEAALRQAAESRLKLLESQLEPHMLFNTLANLRVLMGVNPAQAQTMLDHLVDYLRATLSASRTGSHTLQDEFNRLRDYLELMAVRMGPRLHYTLDLPPELATRQVPPLLLQALVENSIKHGLEPKVQGGSITVSATWANGFLTLDVADTGVGSTVDLNLPASNTHFGLAQVRERLHNSFGTQGTIKFIAAHADGTRARITFPSEI